MRLGGLVLAIAATVVAFPGCEALEYSNVRALDWTVWVLVAFSVAGAIAAIARFIWKTSRGEPTGKAVSARWGSGGWRFWWWMGGSDGGGGINSSGGSDCGD